jgi:hypothetical protein
MDFLYRLSDYLLGLVIRLLKLFSMEFLVSFLARTFSIPLTFG